MDANIRFCGGAQSGSSFEVSDLPQEMRRLRSIYATPERRFDRSFPVELTSCVSYVGPLTQL